MDNSVEHLDLDEGMMECEEEMQEVSKPEETKVELEPELVANVEEAAPKEEEMTEMKTRHVLELLARSCNVVDGHEQMISLVQGAVYEQLKNWGIDFESPTTRGRTKVRKSNKTRSETGQHVSFIMGD